MKKTVIGGFISLIGSIWSIVIFVYVSNNLVSSWRTPPGRFFSTVFEKEMIMPFILAVVFLLTGLIIMGIEYFKK